MLPIRQLLRPSLLTNLREQHNQSKCFVSLMKVAGIGDPFKTTIKRKSKVVDPSIPKFIYNEKPECLQWANWHTLKDLKKRYIISEYYATRVCLLHLYKYKSLPYELREHALDTIMNKFPRKSRWRSGNIRYHCILTGRPKGRVMRFKVSRFIFRDLADYNKLSGVMKGKW